MDHGIFSLTSMVITHLVVDDFALVRHALGLNPFSNIVDFGCERGWPRCYNIPACKKNVGVRGVQICFYKLAANSSDCGLRIFASSTLQCVAKILRLASRENIFL